MTIFRKTNDRGISPLGITSDRLAPGCRRAVTRLATGAMAFTLLTGPIVPSSALARPTPAPEPVERLSSMRTMAASRPAHPVIHVIDQRPDDQRGVVKLARHINSATARIGDVVHMVTYYEEQCVVPCGVPIDNSERPVFFFIRDGEPISNDFRIPAGSDVFTLKFDPGRPGLATTGKYLSYFLLFPVGIPMWIVGRSRLWIAAGPPSSAGDFVRLKGAKT